MNNCIVFDKILTPFLLFKVIYADMLKVDEEELLAGEQKHDWADGAFDTI